MSRVHTHYDNLKVARDASPQAIRAAYQQLIRRYHPDRHPDDPEAARIMALVNAAYDVLSDPVRRAEHDRWLRQQELAVRSMERPKPLHRPPDHPRLGQPRWKKVLLKWQEQCKSFLQRVRNKRG